jgi:Protein of unknown function (DUF3352)
MSLRKRILIIVSAVLVLGLGVFAYMRLSRMEESSRNPLDAIPTQAFFLIGSENMIQTWQDLHQGNLIWDAMTETEWASEISNQFTALDSILNTDKEIASLFNERRCWISFHCTGNQDFDFVLTGALPSPDLADEFTDFVRKQTGNSKLTESEYEQGKLISLERKNDKPLYLGLAEGVVIISGNQELVKTGIDNFKKGISISKNPGFAKVQQTAGEKVAANIYVYYPGLKIALIRLSSDGFKDRVDHISDLASWAEFDISFKANALLLNGYTAVEDSAHTILGMLQGQQSQPVECDKILPGSTISYLSIGISNMDLYLKEYRVYLEQQKPDPDREFKFQALLTKYHYGNNGGIARWIGNEIALAEIPDENGSKSVALLSTNNTAQAKEYLLLLKSDDQAETEIVSSDSSGYTIRKLNAPDFLPVTFGNLFTDLHDCWYTVIHQFVVFAPDINTLKRIIAANENKTTLNQLPVYNDFKQNMATEANLTFYAAPGRIEPLLIERASESFVADLKKHHTLLRRFDGLSLQFTAAQNSLIYSTIFLRHNPPGKKDISTLWETQLDSSFSGRPWLVRDHKTNGLDVFVQDDGNTVYLISSTGSILWKRKLSEKIIGEVQQVDALKNDKLQLVFNTASAIYIIDRNGNDLAPFPVQLKSKATNAIHVFDYENNKEYRMLLACADKKIYNYTIKGKPVDGWKYPTTGDLVELPLQRVVVNNKDYIIAVDRSGKTCITDRQGALRLTLKEQLSPRAAQFFIELGKDLSRTKLITADSLGNVILLSLNDELERLTFMDFNESPGFEYTDMDGDGMDEFVFLSSKKIIAFHQDKSTVLSFSFESAVYPRPLLFAFTAQDQRIGAVGDENNELYLINKGGLNSEGFPMPGNTAFSIGQLGSDGGYSVVCGINRRYIAVYPIK